MGQPVMFAITVLGSSGRFQTLERACASYLLELGGKTIWLDAGGGSWLNLQRTTDHSTIDGVLLTHGHPDHTIDLLQAYHARQFGQAEPLPTVPLWAPQETLDRLVHFSKGIEEAFDLQAVAADDEIMIGSARVLFREMAHPEPTLGVRVELDGLVAAFSSDTGDEADFAALAGDADVFVCEATSQDSDPVWEGHLRASQAGRIAAQHGVKKLILTHLPAGRDLTVSLAEARGAASGVPVELAEDGMRLELTR